MPTRLLAGILLLGVLSACGDRGDVSPSSAPTAGDVPTTPRALAWLASQHTPPVSSAEPVDRDYVRTVAATGWAPSSGSGRPGSTTATS